MTAPSFVFEFIDIGEAVVLRSAIVSIEDAHRVDDVKVVVRTVSNGDVLGTRPYAAIISDLNARFIAEAK